MTNEITLDNAWSIYDNYQLYKVTGNAVNDAPVKTGKVVLPGKIDLAGLEAGTYSLYLYNSKTGSSEGIVVIKN